MLGSEGESALIFRGSARTLIFNAKKSSNRIVKLSNPSNFDEILEVSIICKIVENVKIATVLKIVKIIEFLKVI